MTPPLPAVPAVRPPKVNPLRLAKKGVKRVVPLGLAVYFIPWALGVYAALGLLDVLRNSRRNLATLDRYFFGNGVFTWLLSPFNLLMDVLCLPYMNRGIYKLEDLPAGHRAEINKLTAAAHDRDLIGLLASKLGDTKRAMIFFKWYGKNLPASVDVPEYHDRYRYIRTIGVSVFNKRQSTGLHFGPLRVTLRVLYNVNPIDSPNVYITVGRHTHRWREQQLFIFDDTLQHQSVNESDGVRYCLFVDMLRPTPWPWLLSGVLTGVRLMTAPVRAVFYKHWTVLK
jgi:beta-hydroxylase